MDMPLQRAAAESLVAGAREWERRNNRPCGMVSKLTPGQWQRFRSLHAHEAHRVGDLVYGIIAKRHPSANRSTDHRAYTVELTDDSRYRIAPASSIPYAVGHLLRFRVVGLSEKRAFIEQHNLPPIEGALVSIENRTGYVRALVGGLDYRRSRYNRAVQSQRQPGSAFKPFVYAAAVESAHYGPQTVVLDEPIAIRVNAREPFWVPQNLDGTFQGPMTLDSALSRSRNVVAVKLLLDVGVDRTIKLAQFMGITTPLRETLSLSLGTSEVTLCDMTSAFSVFANRGWKVHNVLVKKVVDRFGNVLEDNTVGVSPVRYGQTPPGSSDTPGGRSSDPQLRRNDRAHASGHRSDSPANELRWKKPVARAAPLRVLSPGTAQIMLEMLKEVCTTGTASVLADMGSRDIGGKTGTADDNTDAWFVGFNADYTTGVWIGYDEKKSLGPGEHGSDSAVPVWKRFMRSVPKRNSLEGLPDAPQRLPEVFRQAAALGTPWSTRANNRPALARSDFRSSADGRTRLLPPWTPFPVSAVKTASHGQHREFSPVDRYWYRTSYEAPEFVRVEWTLLGYANTSFVGDVRILNRNGKTIAEGYVTETRKVIAGFKREVDASVKPAATVSGLGAAGLDQY